MGSSPIRFSIILMIHWTDIAPVKRGSMVVMTVYLLSNDIILTCLVAVVSFFLREGRTSLNQLSTASGLIPQRQDTLAVRYCSSRALQ